VKLRNGLQNLVRGITTCTRDSVTGGETQQRRRAPMIATRAAGHGICMRKRHTST
jgi:hypothetical protein